MCRVYVYIDYYCCVERNVKEGKGNLNTIIQLGKLGNTHTVVLVWFSGMNWLLIDSPFEVSRTRKFGLRLVNFADGQPSLSPRMCVKSINHLKNINICNDKKPIRSRDKDACDTSAQRGMCCCCDGVKCSNVDVVLVSTIWDL